MNYCKNNMLVIALKRVNLSKNIIYNSLKKNLCANVNSIKSNFENEYINMYIIKKQLKISNTTCCKYCKGTGWIIWKTNNLYDLKTNNLYDLKSNKLFVPLFSYSLCFKCI